MKTLYLLTAMVLGTIVEAPTARSAEAVPPNPLIDYPGFLQDAATVGKLREQRRVTEAEFIELARAADTIVLDARSAEKYALLHVKGAVNLSFPDMTEAELAKIIPSKATRVLIYCNNNFENEPVALPSKAFRASLNIHTFNALYSYGYRNIHELAPLLDVRTTRLEMEGALGKEKPVGR